MKTIKKCLSLFLALLTLFSICSASTTVFAAEYTEQKAREEYFDSALSGYLKNIVDTEDAVSISEKQQVDEAVEEVNSSVSRTASTFSLRAASVQSTENVKETVEELDIDHTRLTLELEDGENVAYLFSEPVSFIDDEGNLVYKDTNIKAVTDSAILNRGYSYENGDNDYKAYFSEDSSKGLLLVEKDGEEIRLVPNGTASVGTVEQVESDMEFVDSFEYAGVYGTDTVLRFLPQLNGCKEEIVLSSYQGISDFSFTLYTEEGTIAAINSNGEVEIIDSATKDIITTFVAPFANDSSGGLDITSEHYTDCTYELETVSEGKYTLTICVPEEYLESESTVYPVIIDPTTSNISMELDTAVYSSRSDSPQGANPSACFGKTGTSEYGKGRALYYFPLPSDIKKYAKISSAKLWLREVTGRDTTMYVRPYFVTESWNNSTTWNTQPAYSTTFSYLGTSGVSLARRNINSTSTDHATVPYWYAFNITNAVRAWSTGTSNKGVMFIAECEAADGDYLWRGFATKEHTTSAFRPYAVITYTNDTTKPVISKVTASTSAWTNENVTLTVTASDNVYGIYRYSFIDGDGWRKTNNKTFSENGTIQIRVKDYAGNISDRYTYVIDNIDKTAPTISKVALSSTSWTNGSVKVTVTASDSASGLAAKAYSFDNGSTWQANNYKSFSSNTSTINIKVRDALGNIATYSSNPVKISNIDKTAPTASASADVTSASVKITVTASDELSGLHSTAYSFDEGAWQASNVYLTEPCETITIKVRDKANNIKEFEYTPPAIDGITVTPSISNDEWTNGKVVLTVNGSGIVKYKFGDNDWQTENYFEFAGNGEVVILVEDENGFVANAPTYNITNIDKDDPKDLAIYEEDGLVYIIPQDFVEGTAPETVQYSLNGTNWSSYEEPLNIVRTYGATVYAKVVDGATNKSPIAEITLENTLGEYTASYTDIALGEGLFPVEFGRTYTSTNGWFFTFDANVVKIDDNAYVFTDFYGEKQYFIKNSEGKYLSIDEEELTVNADSYVLAYGDMTCTFGLDGKINRITTDYLDTVYTWSDDGTLTITGGATVTFTNGKPTEITITRTDSEGEEKTKVVKYEWSDDGKLTKFFDAAYSPDDTEPDSIHNYAYTNGLLTTNETETITYSAEGRVKLISQPNGAFVKYTYNDNAENAEAPNNIGAVTVSDSKGVTDTICYADGVYISNTLDSYSDNAVYAPESIADKLIEDTTDNVADVFYVVTEEASGENSETSETTSESTADEEADETAAEEETTDDEGETAEEEVTEETVDETPLYEEIDENTYAFYTYDEQGRVTVELEVLKANITIDENTTFESAEAVAESKVTYVYFGDDSKKIAEEVYYSKVGDEYKPTDKYTYAYTEAGILNIEKYYKADVNYNLCLNYIFTYDSNENIVLEQHFRQETENETTVDVEYKNCTRVYEGENLQSEVYQTLVDGTLTDSNKTEYTYNEHNELLGSTISQYLAEKWCPTYSEAYTYNGYGNITNSVITTTVNTAVAVSDELGDRTVVQSESTSAETIYAYDIWNQQINITVKKTGEADSTTVITYDELGNTSSVTEDGVAVAYTYSNGNVSTVTETKELQQDDETKVTKTVTSVYKYNDGNLVSRTNTTKVDEDVTETTVASYGYDEYGNLTYHEFNGYAFTYNTLGSILTAKAAVKKDENGNETSVDIVSYTYSPDIKQDVLNSSFGNNQIIDYDYNADGEIIAIKLGTDAEPKYEYKYSSEVQMVSEDEATTEEEDTLTANLEGEWVKINDKVSGLFKVIQENKTSVYDSDKAFVYSVETSSKDADDANSFDGTVTTIGGNVYTLVTEENEDTFKTNDIVDFSKKYVYNEEESELERTLTSNVFYTDYGYGNDGVKFLENVFEKNNDGEITEGYIFNYGYKNENISSESLTVKSKAENGTSVTVDEAVSYEYDDNDQLTKATSSTTEWTYEYDSRGNIISKTIKNISTDNTVTSTYGYDSEWQDRLISYNGQEIKYALDDGTTDNSNPLVYRGNALTWTMGRQLASFGSNTYTYNEEGIRTSKTANNVKTTFLLDGYNVIEQTDGTTTLHFFYDSNGEVIGFRYNGNDYFYVKNAMRDIIAITDSNKNIVAEYRYDPWGKVLDEENLTAIGALNPFRYRSYYYDSDIKMYYLQSRYYDAEVGRFINCDDVSYIGVTESENSYNPFAYCENDAVNGWDPSGHLSVDKIKACFKYVFDVITEKVKEFIRKNLGYISGGYLFVATNLIANAIDSLILVGNALEATVKSLVFKKLFKSLRSYAQKHPQKFAGVLKNKIFKFVSSFVADTFKITFKTIVKTFRVKLALEISKAKVEKRLLDMFNVSVWISRLTSTGALVAYVFSLIDGYSSDDYVRVKVRN